LLVTRHGSKYPKEPFTIQVEQLENLKQQFKNMYPNKNDAFTALPTESQRVISDIMKWENYMYGEYETLNNKGELTMNALGKRWNSKLRHIVDNIKTQNVEVIL